MKRGEIKVVTCICCSIGRSNSSAPAIRGHPKLFTFEQHHATEYFGHWTNAASRRSQLSLDTALLRIPLCLSITSL